MSCSNFLASTIHVILVTWKCRSPQELSESPTKRPKKEGLSERRLKQLDLPILRGRRKFQRFSYGPVLTFFKRLCALILKAAGNGVVKWLIRIPN